MKVIIFFIFNLMLFSSSWEKIGESKLVNTIREIDLNGDEFIAVGDYGLILRGKIGSDQTEVTEVDNPIKTNIIDVLTHSDNTFYLTNNSLFDQNFEKLITSEQSLQSIIAYKENYYIASKDELFIYNKDFEQIERLNFDSEVDANLLWEDNLILKYQNSNQIGLLNLENKEIIKIDLNQNFEIIDLDLFEDKLYASSRNLNTYLGDLSVIDLNSLEIQHLDSINAYNFKIFSEDTIIAFAGFSQLPSARQYISIDGGENWSQQTKMVGLTTISNLDENRLVIGGRNSRVFLLERDDISLDFEFFGKYIFGGEIPLNFGDFALNGENIYASISDKIYMIGDKNSTLIDSLPFFSDETNPSIISINSQLNYLIISYFYFEQNGSDFERKIRLIKYDLVENTFEIIGNINHTANLYSKEINNKVIYKSGKQISILDGVGFTQVEIDDSLRDIIFLDDFYYAITPSEIVKYDEDFKLIEKIPLGFSSPGLSKISKSNDNSILISAGNSEILKFSDSEFDEYEKIKLPEIFSTLQVNNLYQSMDTLFVFGNGAIVGRRYNNTWHIDDLNSNFFSFEFQRSPEYIYTLYGSIFRRSNKLSLSAMGDNDNQETKFEPKKYNFIKVFDTNGKLIDKLKGHDFNISKYSGSRIFIIAYDQDGEYHCFSFLAL